MNYNRVTRTYKVNEVGGISRYRFVVLDTTAGQVKYPLGAGAGKVVGIALESRSNGQQISVGVEGEFEVEIASAIGVSDYTMTADNTGKAQSATHTTPESTEITGMAKTAASNAGERIVCDLHWNGQVRVV